MIKTDSSRIAVPPAAKKAPDAFYIFSTLGIIIALPVISLWIEYFLKNRPIDPGHIGKWFAFWAIGVRLFTAGISQILNPAFTAIKILKFRTRESIVVIRELGFANISLGTIGILSLFVPVFLPAVAIAGGLFFLTAGLQHVIKKPGTRNEVVAMVTDLIVFAVMFLYLSFTYFS